MEIELYNTVYVEPNYIGTTQHRSTLNQWGEKNTKIKYSWVPIPNSIFCLDNMSQSFKRPETCLHHRRTVLPWDLCYVSLTDWTLRSLGTGSQCPDLFSVLPYMSFNRKSPLGQIKDSLDVFHCFPHPTRDPRPEPDDATGQTVPAASRSLSPAAGATLSLHHCGKPRSPEALKPRSLEPCARALLLHNGSINEAPGNMSTLQKANQGSLDLIQLHAVALQYMTGSRDLIASQQTTQDRMEKFRSSQTSCDVFSVKAPSSSGTTVFK
ncbi:hypothetical protein F2P81_010924 [Scophthalmus maximus]|uniref:Uncharacterized protein n=1 Tax=Scophthalmus maximus TaxID=52904 RepID=A0A6A4T1Z4_SCOMX|nr:hypothetical protein F2P81_010924 [Scophthalmus maximus]